MLAKPESLETVTLELPKRAHLRPLALSLFRKDAPGVLQGYLTLKPGAALTGVVRDDWVILQDDSLGIPLEGLVKYESLEVVVTRSKS